MVSVKHVGNVVAPLHYRAQCGSVPAQQLYKPPAHNSAPFQSVSFVAEALSQLMDIQPSNSDLDRNGFVLPASELLDQWVSSTGEIQGDGAVAFPGGGRGGFRPVR